MIKCKNETGPIGLWVLTPDVQTMFHASFIGQSMKTDRGKLTWHCRI